MPRGYSCSFTLTVILSQFLVTYIWYYLCSQCTRMLSTFVSASDVYLQDIYVSKCIMKYMFKFCPEPRSIRGTASAASSEPRGSSWSGEW
jgi:hypothetical protein